MTIFLAGLILGVYLGLAGARWLRMSDKPLRLRRRFEFRPGVAVYTPPLDHTEKCARWTRRYILFAEMLARECGKPEHQLPSRADFEQAGVSWRTAWWYSDVLSHAGIAEKRGRAGVYWARDYRARRALTRVIDYPPTLPPRFDFHA